MIQIKNERIDAIINLEGGSLEQLIVDGKSMLWKRDTLWWNRVAPFLFPVVGRLLDNEIIINNKTYTMNQHGFLRDQLFSVANHTPSSCTVVALSDDVTKQQYPFEYKVGITYTLEEQSIAIDVTVTNMDDDPLYYCLGYHPAFNISANAWIELEGTAPFKQYLFEGPYCVGESIYNNTKVTLDMMTYEDATLVYEGVKRAIIHDENQTISMDVGDYPQLGIWQPIQEDGSRAPFVCLEPWVGFGDWKSHDKKIEHKFEVQKLASKASQSWHTQIDF